MVGACHFIITRLLQDRKVRNAKTIFVSKCNTRYQNVIVELILIQSAQKIYVNSIPVYPQPPQGGYGSSTCSSSSHKRHFHGTMADIALTFRREHRVSNIRQLTVHIPFHVRNIGRTNHRRNLLIDAVHHFFS